MKYTLQYDLANRNLLRIDKEIIEGKIMYHGGSFWYDPCYHSTIKAKFIKEENRDAAKRRVDEFLHSINANKEAIQEWNDSLEMPCQELMSR